jgi:uncharacterized protein YdhG (YjbR/CyaY superfamily)
MRPKARSVAEYLAALAPEQRAALRKLRSVIRSALPRAEECISYGIPAFRLDGRVLVWYGAASNHCSFFPGGVVEAFKDDLAGYSTSKGTVRFAPDRPLPAALVRKLVKARIAADAAKLARRARRAAQLRRPPANSQR